MGGDFSGMSGQFALFISVAASVAIILASLRNPGVLGWVYPASAIIILVAHIFCGPSASSVFLAFFCLVSLLGIIVAAVPNKIIFAGSAAVSSVVFAALLKYDARLAARRAQCAHDTEELELSLNETAGKLSRAKTLASDLETRIENYSRLSGFLSSICKIIDINELAEELKKSAAGFFGKGVSLFFMSNSSAAATFGRIAPESKDGIVLSSDGRIAAARFLEDAGAAAADFAWIAARSTDAVLGDDDIRFLSPAFDFARAAAVNVILYEKTRVLSIRDSLTGLYLRDYFFERLSEEFELASGHGERLSVAMFDIDHFKKINDTLGHAAGDEILKSVAHIIERRLRETDILARYGGEEFIAAMPHTGLAEACAVVSEIIKTVGKERFYIRSGDTPHINVTISAGVAAEVSSAEEIVKAADANLYKAKNAGRNRVFPSPA